MRTALGAPINLRAEANSTELVTAAEGEENIVSTSNNSDELRVFQPMTLHPEDPATVDNDNSDEVLALPPSEPDTETQLAIVPDNETVTGNTNESVSSTTVQSTTDMTGATSLPTVNPIDLLGYTFTDVANQTRRRATVKELTKEGKFIIQFLNGGEELRDYNDLINIHNKKFEDGFENWKCDKITGHKIENRKYFVKVLWDNGEETFEALNIMKTAEPLKVSKYVVKHNLTDKHGWRWTKRFARNSTKFLRLARIFKSQMKNAVKMFKFGVQVPKSVKEALEFDKKNKTNLWAEAIRKEIEQLLEYKTFKILKRGQRNLPGLKFIPLHFVFDVKFDLRRKARLVAGGHRTQPANEDIYSGVVSIENVRIAMMLADANKMEVVAADVGNAFLYGHTKAKLYSVAGPEFGEFAGCTLVIVKSIYGLRTSAARWHEAFSEQLRKFGYFPCKIDPDLWIIDKGDHYEYICVYVDDLIIISKDPMELIGKLKNEANYILKGVGEPEYYLGGDVRRIKNADGSKTTILSAKTYIKNVCDKIENLLEVRLRSYDAPLEAGYHPELDDTEFLYGSDISKYRMLVGCANWAVTLGRYDIMFATVTMARYNHLPRRGHFMTMLRVFGYLKNHIKGSIRVNLEVPETHNLPQIKHNWSEIYPGAKEELPPNRPIPKGFGFHMTTYFDADHAHDLETRRSVTGVLVFLNKTTIRWYSKRQNTVETSSYGSELVAARIATDIVIELRLKLMYMGVPIMGVTMLFGDNKSVVVSSTLPSSSLKKKHNAIAYHRVREAIAAGIINLIHIPGTENIADILTKALGPSILYGLVKFIMFGKRDK